MLKAWEKFTVNSVNIPYLSIVFFLSMLMQCKHFSRLCWCEHRIVKVGDVTNLGDEHTRTVRCQDSYVIHWIIQHLIETTTLCGNAIKGGTFDSQVQHLVITSKWEPYATQRQQNTVVHERNLRVLRNNVFNYRTGINAWWLNQMW